MGEQKEVGAQVYDVMSGRGKYLKNMKKGIRKRISVYRRDLWDRKQFRSKEYANMIKIEYDGRKPRRERDRKCKI